MSHRLIVMALLAGCAGGKDRAAEPPPAHPTRDAAAPAAAVCAPGQLRGTDGCVAVPAFAERGALAPTAAALDAVAARLRQAGVLGEAADVLDAIHASARFRRRAAGQPGFAAVDVAALRAATARIDELGRELADAASELRALGQALDAIAAEPGARAVAEVRASTSAAIAATFARRGALITATIADVISPLHGALTDEQAVLDARVCDAPDAALRAPCGRRDALDAAVSFLASARAEARQRFDAAGGAAAAALGALLDEPARTAIDRATGRGPGPGEPCGPDDLCAWRLTCRHVGGAPGTCERTCHEGAMEPCPAGLVCRTLPDLGPVCRP